jgi:hypothetical protein
MLSIGEGVRRIDTDRTGHVVCPPSHPLDAALVQWLDGTEAYVASLLLGPIDGPVPAPTRSARPVPTRG